MTDLRFERHAALAKKFAGLQAQKQQAICFPAEVDVVWIKRDASAIRIQDRRQRRDRSGRSLRYPEHRSPRCRLLRIDREIEGPSFWARQDLVPSASTPSGNERSAASIPKPDPRGRACRSPHRRGCFASPASWCDIVRHRALAFPQLRNSRQNNFRIARVEITFGRAEYNLGAILPIGGGFTYCRRSCAR